MGASSFRIFRRQGLGGFVQYEVLSNHFRQVENLTLEKFGGNRVFVLFHDGDCLESTRSRRMLQFKLFLNREGGRSLEILATTTTRKCRRRLDLTADEESSPGIIEKQVAFYGLGALDVLIHKRGFVHLIRNDFPYLPQNFSNVQSHFKTTSRFDSRSLSTSILLCFCPQDYRRSR